LKKAFQNFLLLFILSLFLVAAGYILNSHFNIGLPTSDIIWLTLAFLGTTTLSLLIFFIGQSKDNRARAFYTLVSLSLKFLTELIIALVWFLIGKKSSISFIILFFVLYLTFTIFSIFMILNALKNKSL
jgi:hypothetical protein